MKHPQYQRHRRYGVEWLQAIFTLMVLGGIYLSMSHFDSYDTKLIESPTSQKEGVQTYWNDTLGYGFHQNASGSYTEQKTASGEVIKIRTASGVVGTESEVQVYFYPNTDITKIQAIHQKNTPRTYSRLSNGIAVIEGNLTSPEAKMILATLHSR